MKYKLALLVLLCLLCKGALAELRNVQIFGERDEPTQTVEVTFTAPLKLVGVAPSAAENTLVLTLESLSVEAYRNWSSNSIQIDEADHDVVGATLTGSHTQGMELTISFRHKTFAEVLPQYNTNHVLLTIAKDKPSADGLATASDEGNLYAITLESRKKSLPSLQDVPKSFASAHKVYVVPFTNDDGQQWQRLRIGVFNTKSMAEQILAQLSGSYPDAYVSNISEAESKFASNYRINPAVALKRAQLSDPDVEAESARVKIRAVTPSSIDDDEEEIAAPTDWQTPDPVALNEWEQLLAEADAAFAARNYAKAIPLYTKIVQQGAGDPQQQALEKLGMSRELNRQIAQAKRNYENYLARYPNTPGAERVRQRLAALIALTEAPQRELRVAKRKQTKPKWQTAAYWSQYYRRHELKVDDDKNIALDGIFSNVNLSARRRGGAVDHELRLATAYLHDFTDRLGNKDLQISSAYWDAYASKYNAGLRLGRQTQYSAGVIGRFDGLSMRYDLSDQYQVGVVTGYLVDSSFDSPNSDRPFYGVFGEYRSSSGALTISPYAVEQRIDGMTDRRALGFQTQWVQDSTMLWTNVDYDIYHKSLNNLMLVANLGIGKKSTYNLSFDQRKSPYLTTRNALIGQPFEELTDLEVALIDLELKELASDRTATTKSVRASWNRSINERWQFSTDIIYSDTSSTDTSASVVGYEARDDLYYSMQLRANDPYGAGTFSSMMVRLAESDNATSTTLFWNNRFSLADKFWFYPRLRVAMREFKSSNQTQYSYVPSIRLDYRFNKKFRFEFEVGYDSTTRETFADDLKISGLFISAGYRALF